MNASTNPYSGHRYPTEINSHAVWLYFRFALSFRDIEELLAARGAASWNFANETVYRMVLPVITLWGAWGLWRLTRAGDDEH